MNAFLTHATRILAEQVEGVQAMVLRGSQQKSDLVDLWSDYDLLIILNPSTSVDEGKFFQAIRNIGVVVASELHTGENSILCRTAVEFQSSIELLDVSVCTYQEWIGTEPPETQEIIYGQIEPSVVPRTPPAGTLGPFRPGEGQIDPTWFKYFIAVKKFCRNDNLIGMHLLLDLVRAYLVLKMVERDNRYKTNIHRFGGNEQLPDAIKLSYIDESDKEKTLDYIARLAYAYDKQLASMVIGYTSRYPFVLAYIERSKACFSRRGHET